MTGKLLHTQLTALNKAENRKKIVVEVSNYNVLRSIHNTRLLLLLEAYNGHS